MREIRASKGMLIVEGDPDCRSAGSFFKNPDPTGGGVRAAYRVDAQEPVPRYPAGTGMVKTSAAWLIERAGFRKGFAIGPRGCIDQAHPGAGESRWRERRRISSVSPGRSDEGVEEKFGVRLVPEPVFVGFDEEF